MRAYLVTGNPGSGKSTLVAELSRRFLAAVEADDLAFWEDAAGMPAARPPDPDGDWLLDHRWVWSRSRIQQAIAESGRGKTAVFVCGIARNQTEMLDVFDQVFLLVIDDQTQGARLAAESPARPEAVRQQIRDGRLVFQAQMVSQWPPPGGYHDVVAEGGRSAPVLDALRQPLESGRVIARSGSTARFPARFTLILAANPCSCARMASTGSTGSACTCTPLARRRYLARLSGPLLDRVDVKVELLPVGRAELLAPLERAMDLGQVSARGADRIIRMSWTLADLAGAARPGLAEVGCALGLWLGVGL